MTQLILQRERIHKLDVIRGFAILGIFFVNIPAMVGNSGSFTGMDKYINLFYDLFIDTRFYTIFAFLFGIGFYIFISRAKEKGLRYSWLFAKRLLILFIFGAIHYIIFWSGDILHMYALSGGFLLFFYRRRLKTVLIWAIAFFTIAHTFIISLIVLMMETEKYASTVAVQNYFDEWLIHVQKRAGDVFSTKLLLESLLFPEILSLFLIGLYVGKKGIFYKIEEYRTSLRKWQLGSLVMGLLLCVPIVIGFFQHEAYVSKDYYFWVMLSGKPLGMFYIITLMLAKGRWLNYFGYVGQMALSNYLAHTLIGVVLLSVFIKQPTSISLLTQVFIVLTVYIAQIFVSKWWINYYRFGPLEWLWRSGTYGKFQSMRRESGIEE
jgi:uncharacterized protein